MQDTAESSLYNLVVIDVDGTLYDSQHRLSPGAEQAIRGLNQQGTRVILASGRPRPGILPLLAHLQLGQAHIGAGGAYAAGLDGSILFQRLLPPELLPDLVRRARRLNLDAALHTYDEILLEGSPAHEQVMIAYNGDGYTRRVKDVLAASAQTPLKITLWGAMDILQRYREEVEPLELPVGMVNSTENFLEINRQGVNKGAALAVLAERLGIPLAQVVAIGDQFNDISMFQAAGLSVAMGNAPEGVKQAAQVVAPSNDEGGVAWAIQKYVARRKP